MFVVEDQGITIRLGESTLYKRTAGLILSGILATGAVGAVAMTPASATTSDNAVTSRLASIKNALSGLVKDGTLTQSQADKVASTLDTKMPKREMRGMGGPGGHRGGKGMGQTDDAAAKALGMTTAELRTALQGGKNLANLATDKKVSVDSLVKAMVAAAEAKLSAAVKDGSLTQAQADKVKSSLTERITERVNNVRPGGMGGAKGHMSGMGIKETRDAAAKALSMTNAELQTALQSGKSLADVAKDKKVSVDSLVKAMVAAAEAKLPAAVKDGSLTQAQADKMKSSLTERITSQVNGVRPDRGADHGAGPGQGAPSGGAAHGAQMDGETSVGTPNTSPNVA
jgi:DNA-directed RNA polymerase specialized sigma subunit